MSTTAILTMILVLTVIWGGFLTALYLALRRERSKSAGNGDKRSESD